MPDYTKQPTDAEIYEATNIVERVRGKDRLLSETECENAGIDPGVINVAVNVAVRSFSPEQKLALALEPGIGIMIGVTLAAAYINSKS